MAAVAAADMSAAELDFEKLRQRKAEIWSLKDFEKLPAALREPLKAESINSVAFIAWLPKIGRWACCRLAAEKPMPLDKRIWISCRKLECRYRSHWTMR